MRSYRFIIPLLSALSLLAVTTPANSAEKVVDARTAKAYGKLPLSFVENKGQLDKRVRYAIHGPRASAFFRNDGITFDLWEAGRRARRDIKAWKPSKPGMRKHAVLKLTFKGADPDCLVKGMDQLPGKVNYMIGKDKSKWHTNIPAYKGVIYKSVWRGIDVIYRGDRRQLKYDIRVNPGADIRNVRLQYDGAQRTWLDKKGDLHIRTSVTEFVERVPGIYQEKAGRKISMTGGYRLLDTHTVGFSVKGADPSLPLIIDPASDLVYSTFLGGADEDAAQSIAVDSSGCAYVAGHTTASGFPTTKGAFRTVYSGGDEDAVVVKLNPCGSALIYSTLLGGKGDDWAWSIAVDSSGCAYVAGDTNIGDFPTTKGAFQAVLKGNDGDAFVTKLNPSGNALLYSTFLGGSRGEEGCSIAVGHSGCAYVAGWTRSADFPTTKGAFQATLSRSDNAFVTKLNPSGSALVYSTLLGGIGLDVASSVAIDSTGCAYVAGLTFSRDFPATKGGLHKAPGRYDDAFVAKLNPPGSALLYSTCLGGGSSDDARSVAVDSSGCAYVAGVTYSPDFPTTKGAFQTTFGASSLLRYDAFVTKLNPSGNASSTPHSWGEVIGTRPAPSLWTPQGARMWQAWRSPRISRQPGERSRPALAATRTPSWQS